MSEEDRYAKIRGLSKQDREEIYTDAMQRSDEIRDGAMCGSEDDDEASWNRNRLLMELKGERELRYLLRMWLTGKVKEARMLRWERGYQEMLDKLDELERVLCP